MHVHQAMALRFVPKTSSGPVHRTIGVIGVDAQWHVGTGKGIRQVGLVRGPEEVATVGGELNGFF